MCCMRRRESRLYSSGRSWTGPPVGICFGMVDFAPVMAVPPIVGLRCLPPCLPWFAGNEAFVEVGTPAEAAFFCGAAALPCPLAGFCAACLAAGFGLFAFVMILSSSSYNGRGLKQHWVHH